MRRVPVTSTSIASVGYDAASRTLEVEFASGGHVYRYFDVPADVHAAFLEAKSHGGFFMTGVRDRYRFERIS
jgi:hypothetical protein